MNSKRFKTPVSIWTFDIWPDAVYSYGVPRWKVIDCLLSRFVRFVYNRCDNVFVSSKNFKDVLSKYTNKEIIYAPNWLQESKREKSSVRLDKEKINFTFAGNVSLYQNLLVTTIGFVKANIDNAVLNIVGNGSAIAEIIEYVQQNKISNVILHGRKPSQEIEDILSQSDVLVLPLIDNETVAKTEPLKLQTYLRVGKPILGIVKGACKEIIEENHLGVCANPSDVDNIAEGFRQILTLTDKDRLIIEQNTNNLLQTRFNKEQTVRKITDKISPP